jgi:hypothetical protein
MKELTKNMSIKDIVYMAVITLILSIGGCQYFNKMDQLNQKFDSYEMSIKSLNDSVTHTIQNGIDVYSKASVEMNLKELTNSEFFKSLTDNQKKFYSELRSVKGLISATHAELRKQGQLLGEIAEHSNPGTVSDDSISFALGTELDFNETDATKKLQWNAKIRLDKRIQLKLDYDYSFNVHTTFVRQKDKSIIVNYTIDDPELRVVQMHNFIIPREEKRTMLGRWLDRNRKPLLLTAGGLLFVGGGVTGYTLAK